MSSGLSPTVSKSLESTLCVYVTMMTTLRTTIHTYNLQVVKVVYKDIIQGKTIRVATALSLFLCYMDFWLRVLVIHYKLLNKT